MTVLVANKNKYRPSIAKLMNLCETNYMLVLRLLADKEKLGEVREFFINESLAYRIEVKEVTKYTSLITMAQQHGFELSDDISLTPSASLAAKQSSAPNTTELTALLTPVMTIRLYHDARMVEVISSQNIARIKPRYDYPNRSMHQPDEKQQILIFLKEWLQLCLQQGQVAVDVMSLSQ